MSALLYAEGYKALMTGDLDWIADTVKVALIQSTYTPNRHTDDFFDVVSGDEASGSGYTAGGLTLANRTLEYNSTTRRVMRKADDASWNPSSVSARYGVVYHDTGTPSTSRLIVLVDFEETLVTSSSEFLIEWAFGIVALTTLA